MLKSLFSKGFFHSALEAVPEGKQRLPTGRALGPSPERRLEPPTGDRDPRPVEPQVANLPVDVDRSTQPMVAVVASPDGQPQRRCTPASSVASTGSGDEHVGLKKPIELPEDELHDPSSSSNWASFSRSRAWIHSIGAVIASALRACALSFGISARMISAAFRLDFGSIGSVTRLRSAPRRCGP